ncbi:MAG: hypothetical protein AAF703_09695 [Cyanobacteria bacterium P01_D01_bin.105]
MTDNALSDNAPSNNTASESELSENAPSPENPSQAEIASVIAELEQYRDRLIEDFTNTAKKAKLPKSMVMAQLKNHPEIVKIDASLAQLRGAAPNQNTQPAANAATS